MRHTLDFRELFKRPLVGSAMGETQRLGQSPGDPGCNGILLQWAEAEAILTRIFSTVTSSWEATLREASVSPDDCQRLSRAFLYPGLELDPDVEG